MRIVLVNWANIWHGAGYGGGVNGYCASLALALVKRGHDVISLCGGTTFVPMPTPDRTSPCFVRRHPDWLGVRVFEIINSPVLAPSILQYQDPLGEMSSPDLEAEVERLFNLLKPEVVHFNNIEGFSVKCVDVARRAGARVIFSLHNYHTICPQVYLMRGDRHACFDADAGHNCVNCIKTRPTDVERYERAAKRKEKRTEEKFSELAALHREYNAEWSAFKHEFTWPVRVAKKSIKLLQLRREIREVEKREPWLIPGYEVDTPESATRPIAVPTPSRPLEDVPKPEEQVVERPISYDHRGMTQGLLDEMHWKPRNIDLSDPANQPLENVARPDPPSTKAPNAYGKRREAMIRMLNSCDRVLAVSEFVRDKFIAMGVDPRVIEAMHIGSRIGRVVERHRELVFDPPPFEEGVAFDKQRPLRLVFMGYNNRYKGLHVFAEALEMLTHEYLSRIDLSIFALDGKTIEWRFRRMEPRLAKLTFVHGYHFQDIPWMLGGKDLGVVPSVWWDNAPQTVFEFFSCGVPVLGARIGGIPDFVKDGFNGILFQANNPWDLARRLVGAIREPWKVTALRANVRPPKEMDAHAEELERVYAELPSSPAAPSAP